MSGEQWAESEPEGGRISFRRPFLFVAFAGLSCWGLALLALAGGYHAGEVVVTWLNEPTSNVAQSTPPAVSPGDTPVAEDLQAIAEELSRISPAAGADEKPAGPAD